MPVLSFRQQGMLLVVLATVLFSTKGVIVKLAYAYPIEPMELLAIRLLMALPFYLLVLFDEYCKGHCQRLNRHNFLPTALFGICGYYIASYFDLLGLVYLPASLERLVLYSYPGIVVLLAAVFFRQRLNLALCGCLLVIYSGLLLVFVEDVLAGVDGSSEQLLGAFYVFIAAFAFAVYYIGSEWMLRSLPSRLFTAVAMLSATGVILLHFHWHYQWLSLLAQPMPVYGYIFLIAFFCTVLPSFMLASGISRIGAATGSVIGSAGPVITLVLAFVLLDEMLTWWQVPGFVLVLVGVFLLGRLRR